MADGEVTADGRRFIANWLSACQQRDLMQRELARAEATEKHVQAELAKWLAPPDMVDGEKIAVWHGDSLFQVERIDLHTLKVTVRSRGKHFSDLARIA